MECAYFEYAGLEDFGVCDSIETAIGIAKTFAQTLQFFHSESKAAAKLAALFYLRHILYPLSQVLNRFCTRERNFILFIVKFPLVFYINAVIILVDSQKAEVRKPAGESSAGIWTDDLCRKA